MSIGSVKVSEKSGFVKPQEISDLFALMTAQGNSKLEQMYRWCKVVCDKFTSGVFIYFNPVSKLFAVSTGECLCLPNGSVISNTDNFVNWETYKLNNWLDAYPITLEIGDWR